RGGGAGCALRRCPDPPQIRPVLKSAPVQSACYPATWPNSPWATLSGWEALTVAQHLASEHFRFTPRTCPSGRWEAELGPKENLHERASYRGETGLGF